MLQHSCLHRYSIRFRCVPRSCIEIFFRIVEYIFDKFELLNDPRISPPLFSDHHLWTRIGSDFQIEFFTKASINVPILFDVLNFSRNFSCCKCSVAITINNVQFYGYFVIIVHLDVLVCLFKQILYFILAFELRFGQISRP